ncbi:Cytochrome c oxidase 15 [Hibiscus syriacus]|uniref:Cytochrome c oxidase 15 n=1 Tax=Hibiscus syriacus TaxID=106335 RepID=A0A6A2YLS8_HIBSY|nr:Cytochrome c oxidase 15 [Hibiscus syriacus]
MKEMESGDDRYIHVVDNDIDSPEATEAEAEQQRRVQAFSVGLEGGGDRKPIGTVIYKSIYTVILSKKFNVLIPFGPLAIFVQKKTNRESGWVIPQSSWRFTVDLQLGSSKCYIWECNGTYYIDLCLTNRKDTCSSAVVARLASIELVVRSRIAFFSGGIVRKVQVFNKATAVVNSGLLLMVMMGLLFPAILHSTGTEVHFGISELALSRVSSCALILVYAISIIFQLKNLNDMGGSQDAEIIDGDEDEEAGPEISKWESVIWLAITAAAISILSEYMVDAIEGTSLSWGVPVAFITVILLPIGGNTAAVITSVMFAMKDKLDVSLGVAIGSSTQISMFIIPFCVVTGWIFGRPVDLNFQPFETATLFMTVLYVAFITQWLQATSYMKTLPLDTSDATTADAAVILSQLT